MDDQTEQFKSFFESPLGRELKRALKEDLHDNLIKEAQKALTAEEAYGLLKEAGGVIKAMEHMDFLSSSAFIPRDKGSKA